MPTKLIGTEPYQVPRNADLGTSAFQDANAVRIEGGYVATKDTLLTGLHQDTDVSDIRPSLLLDFANSKAMDPRVTFTRATTATYYDGRTVAKAEQNCLLYSTTPVNGYGSWSNQNSTATLNAGPAPDGTVTANLLVPNTASGLFHYIHQGTNVFTFASTIATQSVYVKAAGYTKVGLREGQTSGANVSFDLTAGTVISANSMTGTITNVGNGWYRITGTYTIATAQRLELWILPASYTSGDVTGTTWAGDGVSGVYYWGPQIEERSVATPYIPTTTQVITNYVPVLQTAAAGVPRFDHNPLTSESLGLLIEEQRTNICLYSQTFVTGWSGLVGVANNVTISPAGTLTASALREVTSAQYQRTQQNFTISSGATYTLSVYAKKGSRDWLTIDAGPTVYYNLSTGTVGSIGSGATASITSVGNGWYRCIYTYTNPSSLLSFYLGTSATGADGGFFTGTGYDSVYVWGAQTEAGAFATSYIPTVSSAVTRSIDTASMTGTNFSSWYNNEEGTLYAESQTNNTSNTYVSIAFLSGTAYRGIGLVYNAAPTGVIFEVGNITGEVGIVLSTNSKPLFSKMVGAYKFNDFASCVSGGSVGTDTAGTIPLLDNLKIGALYSGSLVLNGTIKKLAYYPKRLSNAELQEITL